MFNEKSKNCLIELLKNNVISINCIFENTNNRYSYELYFFTNLNFIEDKNSHSLYNPEEIVDLFNYNEIHPYWGKLLYLKHKRGLHFNKATENLFNKEKHLIDNEKYVFLLYKDNKRAHWLIKGKIFGGADFEFAADLSCQDSPNSAGVVIDAIRYVKVANELQIYGPVIGPSAFTQKTPPIDMSVNDAYKECEVLSERRIPKGYTHSLKYDGYVARYLR